MTVQRIVAPCKVCRVENAVHERINPVSRGMEYWRCRSCGIVIHVAKTEVG